VVDANNLITVEGTGTIAGMGSCSFKFVALDGSPDTFYIKLWKGSQVIFENTMGTALGGGSIVLHKSSRRLREG
jgi:hypothetical protein